MDGEPMVATCAGCELLAVSALLSLLIRAVPLNLRLAWRYQGQINELDTLLRGDTMKFNSRLIDCNFYGVHCARTTPFTYTTLIQGYPYPMR